MIEVRRTECSYRDDWPIHLYYIADEAEKYRPLILRIGAERDAPDRFYLSRAESERLRDQLDALLRDPAEPTAEEMLAVALDELTGSRGGRVSWLGVLRAEALARREATP